uniref:Ig-like domain-containing protein n=1 Tax=Astatotilapia calliptera TaxID=8154 RepID=A0A3P8QRQ7_ASTCA
NIQRWTYTLALLLSGITLSEMKCQVASELIVNPGQDAPLQCQGPRDAEITLLEWNRADLKSDDYVFLYRNQRPYENYQHESFKGRVNLMDPSMKDGNVSVTLRNVKLTDTGTYKCQITTKETESVVHECSISLKVTTSGKFSLAFLWEQAAGGGAAGMLVESFQKKKSIYPFSLAYLEWVMGAPA